MVLQRRMGFIYNQKTVLLLALAIAIQAQTPLPDQFTPSQAVLAPSTTQGSQMCLTCTTTVSGGQITSSTGCDEAQCGYCSLQTLDNCAEPGPDGTAICEGFCSVTSADIADAPSSPGTVIPPDNGQSYVVFGPIPTDLFNIQSSAEDAFSNALASTTGSTTYMAVPQSPAGQPTAETPAGSPFPAQPVPVAPEPEVPPPESSAPSEEVPPAAPPSEAATPGSDEPIQCTATVSVSSSWSNSPVQGDLEESVNVYLKNLGSADIQVPYSVSVTIPGATGTLSTWNWGTTIDTGNVLTGEVTVGWETLKAGQGNEVNIGAIVQLNTTTLVPDSVQPTNVAINGQNCVLS